MLAFSSCSTTDGTENVTAIETPDGAIIVETLATKTTVITVRVNEDLAIWIVNS